MSNPIFRMIILDDSSYAIVEGDVNVNATFRIEQKMALPTTDTDPRAGFIVKSGLTHSQALRALACYTGQKQDVLKAV
ncbi:MAG: hypothetical protein WC832_02100 [Anaerolineales bacterium]